MTVSSEVSTAGPFFGNGSTTVFPYGFKILDAKHLQVVVMNANLSMTTLSLEGGDYTVTGVGDEAGGTIVKATPLLAGQKLSMVRSPNFTQDTTLENQGAYYPEVIENRFDMLTMQVQAVKEGVERALTVPVGEERPEIKDVFDAVVESGANADAAAASATLSMRYANEAENAPVGSGLYSAFHWFRKALAQASAAAISAAQALTARDWSYKWASEAENTQVNDGTRTGFSAYHWAKKAESFVGGSAYVKRAGDSMSWVLRLAFDYPQIWWGDAATGTGWRIIKDTPEGQVGSLVFQCSTDRWVAGANMKTAMYLGANAELYTDVVNVAKQMRVPNYENGGGQFNGILPGNGDAASYSTYNFSLSGWWGMGMRTYDGSINGYYDFRTGTWDVKGAFKVNGNVVPHGGFKASTIDVANGVNNMFPDAAVVKAVIDGWSSAQQTWTLGGSLVVAHGLPYIPKNVILIFVCKAALGGYAVGDRILFSGSTAMRDENYAESGYSIVADASNIRIPFSNAGVHYVNKSGGGVGRFGPANFDVIVVARL